MVAASFKNVLGLCVLVFGEDDEVGGIGADFRVLRQLEHDRGAAVDTQTLTDKARRYDIAGPRKLGDAIVDLAEKRLRSQRVAASRPGCCSHHCLLLVGSFCRLPGGSLRYSPERVLDSLGHKRGPPQHGQHTQIQQVRLGLGARLAYADPGSNRGIGFRAGACFLLPRAQAKAATSAIPPPIGATTGGLMTSPTSRTAMPSAKLSGAMLAQLGCSFRSSALNIYLRSFRVGVDESADRSRRSDTRAAARRGGERLSG